MSAAWSWDPPAEGHRGMVAHHDRVRAVLHVAGVESDRRREWGEAALTVADRTARLSRLQICFTRLRQQAPAGGGGDARGFDEACQADAEAWLLAAYDATLAELCWELDLRHALDDVTACPELERQRVELELLTSLLPLG